MPRKLLSDPSGVLQISTASETAIEYHNTTPTTRDWNTMSPDVQKPETKGEALHQEFVSTEPTTNTPVGTIDYDLITKAGLQDMKDERISMTDEQVRTAAQIRTRCELTIEPCFRVDWCAGKLIDIYYQFLSGQYLHLLSDAPDAHTSIVLIVGSTFFKSWTSLV
ncbi:hypothetical protein QFC19_001405 [Naganishia cerealis]|uniref:Uncharacterized protein n=1 Tax=Naganishia cerealis TaxID=610337 RepID=A0ACC2WII9_9TREE|nr:hypothetical protein QFC19_001405 [Naganishia cerealis]